MNETKRQVHIHLQTDHDGERMAVKASGHVYLKGRNTYVRFEEPKQPDRGSVTTTMKIADGELRVLRQGAIRSEQRFAAGKLTTGYYETAQGSLQLETKTIALDIALNQGSGYVEWSYELVIGGAGAGHFRLRLEVQEEI